MYILFLFSPIVRAKNNKDINICAHILIDGPGEKSNQKFVFLFLFVYIFYYIGTYLYT